ncbi:MAG: NDP-sugar synthase [Actinomycetota bacterium]|nr:NDP-sugar synthase [Actinomycetota bacterium]
MKALILTGGFGTRLRPLTETRPKHLLPIANRPHVEHVFDLLVRQGISEVVLLTSYLADAFAPAIERGRQMGLRVEVTHEEEPLGTAGAIKNAQSLVSEEALLVFNGDILTDIDLSTVVEWHRSRAAEATILLTPVEDPSAFGVVPTEPDGRVLGFIEKPPAGIAPTNLINAGIYVFEPSILDRIPAGEVWSAERQLFPQLVEEGAALYALGGDAYWMDIGTPQKYLEANLDALAGRFVTDAVPEPGVGSVVAGEDVYVHSDAMISEACLGADTRICEATVERSVLLPGVTVEERAVVRGAVLGEGVLVEAGAEAVDVTVADHEVLPASG